MARIDRRPRQLREADGGIQRGVCVRHRHRHRRSSARALTRLWLLQPQRGRCDSPAQAPMRSRGRDDCALDDWMREQSTEGRAPSSAGVTTDPRLPCPDRGSLPLSRGERRSGQKGGDECDGYAWQRGGWVFYNDSVVVGIDRARPFLTHVPPFHPLAGYARPSLYVCMSLSHVAASLA